MIFQSVFPYTQEIIAEHPVMDDAAINNCLTQSAIGFEIWKQYSYTQRAAVLLRLASLLRTHIDDLAALITHEMGKLLAEAKREIEKSAFICEYYAENGAAFLKDEQHDAGHIKSFVTHQPIGAVLGIMPWNFPFWQAFRYAAPVLLAGNVTLLKHAPNVCGCAKKIEQLFTEAGTPPGVFQSLIIDTPAVEKLLQHTVVQGVTLTGSERAGSAVAALAGRHIKKSVLELGGADALIVLPDANIKKAAATAMQSRMINAGQACNGAKRFIVLDAVKDEFMHEILLLIKNYKTGNPFHEGVTMAPLARIDLAEKLQQQLHSSMKLGARLLHGGLVKDSIFEPALLVNVSKGMAAFDEETFGPLATVITVKTEAEALAEANDSAYGLCASIWTTDIDKALAMANHIHTGGVFINSLVKSDPRLPFGGIKKSGYGREMGRAGILEFVNVKTVVVD